MRDAFFGGGATAAAAIEIRANKSRASLLPFSSPLRDPSARFGCRRAYVRTRAYATHARTQRSARARVYTCTRMHVEARTRGSTCVLFRPCVYLEASESLARSSQATRCTGSREKLHAALRECRRHVQGVPLRRARRFAQQERCGELAGFARVGSSLSRCVSSFFFPLADRFVESPIFILAITARSSQLVETLRETSRFGDIILHLIYGITRESRARTFHFN